jgi:hypothetical protein
MTGLRAQGRGRANGRATLHAVHEPAVQTTQTLPRNAPRWLLWTAGAAALAVCVAVLLLWGIYGPTYIFDLIAAYCG